MRRARRPALEAIEHLVGMQAQAPNPPYVGLWTRLEGFAHDELSQLVLARQVVRTVMMRSTIHLVSSRDCLTLRPVLQGFLERAMLASRHGKGIAGIDPAALTAAGRALIEERPLTLAEQGAKLAERWPGRDPTALAQAIRTWVPSVQVPPRGLWGGSGQAQVTSVEAWLGQPLGTDTAPDSLVLRYLAAFGPATVKDVQLWSGLTRLREVIERLKPQLRVFHDEHGDELLDLPNAPRPDADAPAPVRFIAEFDNLTLSHEDRSRIISTEDRSRIATLNGIVPGLILVDGFVEGTWKLERQRTAATLHILPFRPLAASDRTALADEGAKLLAFLAGDTPSQDVRFGAEKRSAPAQPKASAGTPRGRPARRA
ncbi:AlkZ family DNA glycosylase [Myxococcaceae bacterium JPH2]|nr:AlkZ family DNA glycosylase [Myxococcaceae bacterium JPH2]